LLLKWCKVDTFAFIIHPINPKQDVSRKYPLLGRMVSEKTIHRFSPFFPPVYISEIEGVTSAATGKTIRGWFVACPLTPKGILELPEKTVYRKIIQTGRLAEKLGAKILGLGAFTSVVGDSGQTIAQALDVPVTTGDSYTVALAVQAVGKAAEMMEISMGEASAAVVGASGAIGRVCAELLAEKTSELYLIGRNRPALDMLRSEILEKAEQSNGLAKRMAEITVSTDLEALRNAQLIITVTSAVESVIQPKNLRPGSVIYDVARPRDVSAKVGAERDDILVIDGGMVDVPGPVNFNFNFGFPAGKAYACMAETMALALEGRFEDYSLGKRLNRGQVEEISSIAEKHGFRLSGFRSFERTVTDEHIERVRQKARGFVRKRQPTIIYSSGG
jgi:fatty aldehyde-generating acyl-ACP reductase